MVCKFVHRPWGCDAVDTCRCNCQLYCCNCVHIVQVGWYIRLCLEIKCIRHVWIQRGDRGVWTPTLKILKNIRFLSNTGPDPLKITKLPSQHSMLGNHCHLNGVSLAANDGPLSPHQLKKSNKQTNKKTLSKLDPLDPCISGQCSKISNTFLLLFLNKSWNSQNACQKQKIGKTLIGLLLKEV